MKNSNALKCWLSVILSLCLTSCATKPPDVFVYEHLAQRLVTDPVTGHLLLKADPVCMKEIGEAECGHGVAIVSQTEIVIGESKCVKLDALRTVFKCVKPWSQLRRESVYVPAVESYAPLATYIINSCKKMNCDDQVTKFKIGLDSLNGIDAVLKQNLP